MSVATRGSVHRSVANPCAGAPCSSARSTRVSAAWSRRGLRPARPAAFSPRRPCSCQAWNHRWAAATLTPSRRATAFCDTFRANSRAAAIRRASSAAKSRRVPRVVAMRQHGIVAPESYQSISRDSLGGPPQAEPRSSLPCVKIPIDKNWSRRSCHAVLGESVTALPGEFPVQDVCSGPLRVTNRGTYENPVPWRDVAWKRCPQGTSYDGSPVLVTPLESDKWGLGWSMPYRSVVPKGGLEPPRVAPHAPQTCASANSATSAPASRKYAVGLRSCQ